MTCGELTLGSWSPELLPTLVVREAYGTRARYRLDGRLLSLSRDGHLHGVDRHRPGGRWCRRGRTRDRWANFWVMLIGVGCLLMLGGLLFCTTMPIGCQCSAARGAGAVPHVGFAGCGGAGGLRRRTVGRPGAVSLKNGLIVAAILVAVSIPIMIYIYAVVWTRPKEWTEAYHLVRYRWLGRELAIAAARTAILAFRPGWSHGAPRRQSTRPAVRGGPRILPLLVLADLLAHTASTFRRLIPAFGRCRRHRPGD